MHWNRKTLLAIVVWMVVCAPMLSAEQTLHWKNGDVLPGRLLAGEAGTIRWESPYFSDDLVVDIGVLESVVFPQRAAPATEDFRISTVFGDIWMADIVDSDADTFLFFSERHGEFRVNREAIYTLERRLHPNLIFDGSHLANWKVSGSEWYADRVGHPRTDKAKSKIFYPLEWPQRFEVDLEIAAGERPPGFVFAFGNNLYETLRLETWVNELVVVQGTLFESVLTVQPGDRKFRLRLVYDAETEVLDILDFAGNLLRRLEGVEQTVKDSGVYIYNRGQDLTVRRLRVYEEPIGAAKQKVDSSKPRVRQMNGDILYGKLFVHDTGSYVLDADGVQQAVDVAAIDRLVQPGATFVESGHPVALTYSDGAVLQGEIVQVEADRVLLQTMFAAEPVACVFAGASLLRVEHNASGTQAEPVNPDRLFHLSGELRGRVSLDGEGTDFLRWQSIGAAAVRVASTAPIRIDRNNRRATKAWPFDASQFHHVLHLKSGESIPCQLTSYTGTGIDFRSPFIETRRIDSAAVKALEFSDRTHATDADTERSRRGNRMQTLFGAGDAERHVVIKEVRWENRGEGPFVFEDVEFQGGEITVTVNGERIELQPGEDIDDILSRSMEPRKQTGRTKLDRALTVPRFNRDTPPTHILVAKNGDIKRGKLLGFNGETLQFDSKLRAFTLPIVRVTRVVEVSANPPPEAGRTSQQAESDPLCVRLTDGSLLRFQPIGLKDDTLFGHSRIYGEVSVPVEAIQRFYFGATRGAFEAPFETWVVRPAKEPAYESEP